MRRLASKRSPVNPTERLELVEGMRGVAALYVVLGHIVNMVDPGFIEGKSISPLWLQRVMAPFAFGHLAVAAFIVLSGFCLQLSLFNGRDGRIHDLKRFYARRAWRILPAYYACLALSVACCYWVTQYQKGMPFSQYVPVTRENLLAHVFMVHNLSLDWLYKINGVLWSIALEAQLYIVFPLLVWTLFRVGRVGLLAVGSALAALCVAVVPVSAKLFPWFIPLFCLGMASAHLAYKPNLRVGTVPRLASLVLFGAVVGMVFALRAKTYIPSDLCIGVAVSALVYLGAVAPWIRVPGMFGWRPLVRLGAFSYSLYLMHHPILQVLYVYRPLAVKGPLFEAAYCLVVAVPVILLGTWLFSLVFERPFITKKAGKRQTERSEIYTPVSLPLRTLGMTRTYAVVAMEEVAEPTPARISLG